MLQLSQIKDVLAQINATGDLPEGFKHEFYTKSVELKGDIEKVFGDEYPDYLSHNRPREKKEHKIYREKIYQNTHKDFLDKQIERLDYIPESDDFSVVWAQGKQADLLRQLNSEAFEEKSGLDDWFFDFVKADFVKDPNAVLAFVPYEKPETDLDPYKPMAELIPCENVWMFRKGKLAVLKSTRENKVVNLNTGRAESNGLVLYFFDHESYTVVTEIARNTGDKSLRSTFNVWGLSYDISDNGEVVGTVFDPPLHRCKSMPARKIGKKRIAKNGKGEELFASTVSNAVPHIKDAQARYSDIQVEFNYHVNSQEYRVATRSCSVHECTKGKVPIRKNNGEIESWETCKNCQGTGMEIGQSALDFIVYSMPKKDGFTEIQSGSVPPVPGGFIARPIESVRELVNEYKRKSDEAYATVHMAFYNRTPLVQSGVAKEVDREEFYRDYITLAKHMCNILQWAYEVQAHYMFGFVGVNTEEVPKVITPSRLMLSGIEETRAELVESIEKNFDPVLVRIIQSRLLEYQAGKDSTDYKRYLAKQHLDPLRAFTPTDKALQVGVISQMAEIGSESYQNLMKNFILSAQFDAILDEIEISKPDFYTLPIAAQKPIIEDYLKKYTSGIPSGKMPTIM